MKLDDDQLDARPERGDGRDWHPRHIEAAIRRAEGEQWDTIADELGVSYGTARNYAGLEGFDELVEFYVAQLARAKFRAIERECVELVVHGKAAALATLVGAAAEGNVDAAVKFLEAIGFVEKNRALAKFQATQSQVGGDGGPKTLIINRRDLGAATEGGE